MTYQSNRQQYNNPPQNQPQNRQPQSQPIPRNSYNPENQNVKLPFLDSRNLKQNGSLCEFLDVRKVETQKFQGYMIDVDVDGFVYVIGAKYGSVLLEQLLMAHMRNSLTLVPGGNEGQYVNVLIR